MEFLLRTKIVTSLSNSKVCYKENGDLVLVDYDSKKMYILHDVSSIIPKFLKYENTSYNTLF